MTKKEQGKTYDKKKMRGIENNAINERRKKVRKGKKDKKMVK